MEGVIRVPLAPIRSEPSDRAEMVTQALFGEQVQLEPIEGQLNWYSVTLGQDGYRGFIDPKLVDGSPDAVAAFQEACHVLPAPLTAIEWGSRHLHLPAGSRIPRAAMPEYSTGAPSGILDAALQFLGAPYLWGGKSILGMDCSGLTQLTGQLCGVNIPRDANLQWDHSSNKRPSFSALENGDLVFFHKEGSNAVTHVGLAICSLKNERQIIHASGEVRIDDLTPQGILRDGQLTHLWTGASGWPFNVE